MKHLRVAMIAPPWLPIPPDGYGGTENVIAGLVPALMDLGLDVELFATGDTTLRATKNHWIYKTGQYKYIHQPLYEALAIPIAHFQFALNTIRNDGGFDIVHSHDPYLGMAMTANSNGSLPPVMHTLHGPPFTTSDRLELGLPDNLAMWSQLSQSSKSQYVVGISRASMRGMPPALGRHKLKPVHNGVDVTQFPFVDKKSDYFMTLARFHPDKGQKLAVEACLAGNYRLKMAGVVADMTKPKQVLLELGNPYSSYRSLLDFRYFSDYVFPYLDDGQIEYVGDLTGDRKMKLLADAKALLFPIQWEEPFGMAPIEALACGTPVVAMARGALPEIIEHGVNGFLARTKNEFQTYMKRVGDIDPAACRTSVENKFSATIMAKNYLDRYTTILAEQS